MIEYIALYIPGLVRAPHDIIHNINIASIKYLLLCCLAGEDDGCLSVCLSKLVLIGSKLKNIAFYGSQPLHSRLKVWL